MFEMFRELIPIIVGALLPPFVLMVRIKGDKAKFVVTILTACVVGACVSAIVGELAGGMPDALIAVMVDASLVYAGYQIAYNLAWESLLGKVKVFQNVESISK